MKIASITVNAFPGLALLFSFLAIQFPHWFTPLAGWIFTLLGIIMFTMGMTLKWIDFANLLKNPILIAFGVIVQFLFMPLLAWLVAGLLNLPLLLTTGLILVGSCPGGTASNVICYLSKGNVALSVTLTMITTLLAVIATPLLTWFYVGQSIDVPWLAMLLSLLKIVLLPVIVGIMVNTYLDFRLEPIKPFLPVISVLTIVIVIAIVIALNVDNVTQLTLPVTIAVIMHNLLGLLTGYVLSRWAGYDVQTARTLAIEIGIQNSGLGTALAVKYFGALAALPGVLFSIWQNLFGALLAQYWRRNHL
jgi:BASS family bile acid:Na+ symporter